MAYAFQLDSQRSLATAIYDGTTSLYDRLELLDSIAYLRAEYPRLRVLIDMRRAGHNLKADEEVAFGMWLADHSSQLAGLRVALVSGGHNPHSAIQTVVSSRGCLDMKEFEAEESALNWLNR